MKLPLTLPATALIARAPARADAHAAYFAEDVEFHHGASGLTRGREAMLPAPAPTSAAGSPASPCPAR